MKFKDRLLKLDENTAHTIRQLAIRELDRMDNTGYAFTSQKELEQIAELMQAYLEMFDLWREIDRINKLKSRSTFRLNKVKNRLNRIKNKLEGECNGN